MNAWMRTLPLPQYLLTVTTLVYSVSVGLGTTFSTLAFNEPWKRETLAYAIIYSVVTSIVMTVKERSRRKGLAATQ